MRIEQLEIDLAEAQKALRDIRDVLQATTPDSTDPYKVWHDVGTALGRAKMGLIFSGAKDARDAVTPEPLAERQAALKRKGWYTV